MVLLGCNILGKDAIPWEGMQSWQEMRQHSLPRGTWHPRESRCPGGMLFLPPPPGRIWPWICGDSMSLGCRNPSAGAGRCWSPHKPQNWTTSYDQALEDLQSSCSRAPSRSIPRTPIPQILLTTNPAQLSSLLVASLFMLTSFYFVSEHQPIAPRVWKRESTGVFCMVTFHGQSPNLRER